MTIKSGIYKIVRKIENKENKVYIGSSVDINKRISTHKSMLRNNKHDNVHLQRSWNKNGENSFTFEVVEYVENTSDLIEKEQFYIETLKTYTPFGFNICRIPNRQSGVKWSDEQRIRQSEKLKKYYLDNNSPMKGKKLSKEAKFKISENNKELVGEKNGFYGKTHSDEFKKRMSERMKGFSLTEEHKSAISNAHRGSNCKFSKLEESDVHEIIKLIKEGVSITDISKIFNVTKQAILSIKNGVSWKHVTGGEIKPNVLVSKSGSKLKVEQVKEIIELLKENVTCAQIARMYSVSQETINAIKLKRTWKHIPR